MSSDYGYLVTWVACGYLTRGRNEFRSEFTLKSPIAFMDDLWGMDPNQKSHLVNSEKLSEEDARLLDDEEPSREGEKIK